MTEPVPPPPSPEVPEQPEPEPSRYESTRFPLSADRVRPLLALWGPYLDPRHNIPTGDEEN